MVQPWYGLGTEKERTWYGEGGVRFALAVSSPEIGLQKK